MRSSAALLAAVAVLAGCGGSTSTQTSTTTDAPTTAPAIETGAKDVHSGTTGGVARNPIGELAALLAPEVRAAAARLPTGGFTDFLA